MADPVFDDNLSVEVVIRARCVPGGGWYDLATATERVERRDVPVIERVVGRVAKELGQHLIDYIDPPAVKGSST